MSTNYYFLSSPLHLLFSANLALVHRDDENIVVLMPREPTHFSATRVMLLDSNRQQRDSGELLSRLGSPRTVRLMRRLGKLSRKPKAFQKQGSMVVSLFRDNGADLEPGDRILVYADRWDIFPLGERAHIKQRLVDSYRVTRELSLALEKKSDAR